MKVIYNGTEIDADGPIADACCKDYILARYWKRNPETASHFKPHEPSELLEKWLAASSPEVQKDILRYLDLGETPMDVQTNWLVSMLLHRIRTRNPNNSFKTYSLLYRRKALQLAISVMMYPRWKHLEIVKEAKYFFKEANAALKEICKGLEGNDSSQEALDQVITFEEEDALGVGCWTEYTSSWARGYIHVSDNGRILTIHPRGNRARMISKAWRAESTTYHREVYFRFGLPELEDLISYAEYGNGYDSDKFWPIEKIHNAAALFHCITFKGLP